MIQIDTTITSRAEALASGALVDAGTLAREVGFRWPTALTAAAHAATVAVPAGCEGLQDEVGRLWDVLFLAAWAVRRQDGDRARYRVSVVTGPEDGARRDIDLEVVCHPGDDAEPVLTICLPSEVEK